MSRFNEDSLRQGIISGALLIRLTQGLEDVKICQKLRFDVFNLELNEGIPENLKIRLDIDPFDQVCDHLMILNQNMELVGTYRLLWGPQASQGFYSATEFTIDHLIQGPISDWVELGRACVRPDYRKQSTLMSLFFGIHKYMQYRKARYLFGCGSLPPKTTQDDAEFIYNILKNQNLLLEDRGVQPLPMSQFKGDARKGVDRVPDLLHFYFRFGAIALGRPAYDPIFRNFDLLTFFDLQNLSPWGSALIEKFESRLQKHLAKE